MPIFAPLGVGLLGLLSLFRRRFRGAKAWLYLWTLFLVPLLLSQALGGNLAELSFLLDQAAVGLGAGILLFSSRRALAAGLLTALVILAAAGAYSSWLSARSWDGRAGEVVPHSINLTGSIDRVSGAGDAVAAQRTWSLQQPQALELLFEARLVSGTPDWDWIRSDENFRLEALQEEGRAFTRVHTPLGIDPYVYQRGSVGSTIANRQVRTRLELRAPEGRACGRLYLAEPGARHVHFRDLCLESEWQSVELSWQVPETAQHSSVDVNLNDFDGHVIDVRDVALEVLEADTWRSLLPLIPTGVLVTADWPTRPSDYGPGLRFLPEPTWRPYRLSLEHESLAGAELIQFRLHFSPGFMVEIRDVRLEAPATANPVPVPTRDRQTLWFDDPNLLGHTIAVSGIVLLVLLRPGWLLSAALVVTLAGLWFTGSRGAWLALVAAALLTLILKPRGALWVLAPLLLGLGLLSLLGGGMGRLQILGVDEVVSRPEIWRAAARAFLDHPWTGIGSDAFAQFWQARYSSEIVEHAHNFWLALASSYGVGGLLAALWLSGGLIYLAWRWGNWQGLALVMPVLLMNVFDNSLLHAGVLFPLILAMNALGQKPLPVPISARPRQDTQS